MNWTNVLLILCLIGWGITLYVYSRKFKSIVDSNAQKIKNKLDSIIEKTRADNRKVDD